MNTSVSSFSHVLLDIQEHSAPYIYSIELILGLINCSLNILLLSRRQFRSTTCYLYFLAASVAMLFNITFGLSSNLYIIMYENLTLTSSIFCKARYYFIQCTAMMYRWYLVAACLDRCMFSSDNIRLRNLANMNVAYRIIIINPILWFILPIHILISFDIKNGLCSASTDLAQYYHSIFTLVAGCLLPASIMIISAFLIYRNLVHKHLRRQTMIFRMQTIINDRDKLERKRNRQIFIILISQVTIFIITTVPWMTYFFFIAVTINFTNQSDSLSAIQHFCAFIIEPIVYLFPILSFYLYVLSSNMFRRALRNILQNIIRILYIKQRNQIEPNG